MHIGVIRRNGFGDVLCTIPLILYCKERWPEATVTLFVEEKTLCLAPYLVGPDRVVAISPGKNKYLAALRTALQYRGEGFDLAISAKTSPMRLMNLFLFALGARRRFAYTSSSLDRFLVNRRAFSPPPKELHQAMQILRLLDPNIEEIPSSLFPQLKGLKKRKLALCPTLFYSVSNNRIGCTLSIEKAASILNSLGKEKKFCTVINCLPQDIHRAKHLHSLLTHESIVMPTELFSQFLEILYSSDGVFVGDGGVCHLAAAMDKKIVALYGGTNLDQWKPLSAKAVCLKISGHVDDLPEEKIRDALKSIVD